MKKIINAYKSYEHLAGYRAPEFTTNASEFHVTPVSYTHLTLPTILRV